FGPSWLVLFGAGGGVAQVWLSPHPKFRRDPVRFGSKFTSSLQFGPFSVTWDGPSLGGRPNRTCSGVRTCIRTDSSSRSHRTDCLTAASRPSSSGVLSPWG